jgi:motility quorum-sensing regulator/GCU-specific mRNA interferase toxin
LRRILIQKRVSHYNLDFIKELISANQYFIAQSARQGYFELAFDDDEVLEIIISLVNKDLYKSMTTYHDNKIWQDVYRKTIDDIDLYIKLQISDKAIVISFKERT